MEKRYACYIDALVQSPDDFERVDEIIRSPDGDVIVRGQGRNGPFDFDRVQGRSTNAEDLLDSLPFQSWLLDD